MSFVYLILGWIVLTSLGIGLIVAAEPLWTRGEQPIPCAEKRPATRR